MKIGVLSKKINHLAGEIKDFLIKEGHQVTIFTGSNLCINETLFEYDFFIQKSKKLFFLYAGFFLEANGIPVIPKPLISYKNKNRIEAHHLMDKARLLNPRYYVGSVGVLKRKLKEKDYPLILKPLMSSGSRGIKLLNSVDDFNDYDDEIFGYVEQYIIGNHYNVYFIDDDICVMKKPPLSNEHVSMERVSLTSDMEEVILKWKKSNDLLFGHLDIVREDKTEKLYVVDPGSFPEFTNWKCNGAPVSKICKLILEKYEKIKNGM